MVRGIQPQYGVLTCLGAAHCWHGRHGVLKVPHCRIGTISYSDGICKYIIILTNLVEYLVFMTKLYIQYPSLVLGC